MLRLAQARVEDDPEQADRLLGQASDELAQALEELRELARGIHPAVLSDRGLGAALEALLSRTPLPVELEVPDARLPKPVEAAAYYVVSEALANVAKYAEASSVAVSIASVNGHAVVEVADDGVGGADPTKGSGLRGLVDRVDATFERAVQLLFECRGRVIVTGMGKSGIICRKIAATLSSTGTAAWFLHPAEAIHVDLGAIRPRAPANPKAPYDVSSELVVEWRALTVALMDRLVELVRGELALGPAFAMPHLLQGGTWRAGRKIALALRPPHGPSQIPISPDGTVF